MARYSLKLHWKVHTFYGSSTSILPCFLHSFLQNMYPGQSIELSFNRYNTHFQRKGKEKRLVIPSFDYQ